MLPKIPSDLVDETRGVVYDGKGLPIRGSPFWIRIKNRTRWTVTGYLTGPDPRHIPVRLAEAKDLVRGPLGPNPSCAADCDACIGQYAFFVGNEDGDFWVRFVAVQADSGRAISTAYQISPNTLLNSYSCCLQEADLSRVDT